MGARGGISRNSDQVEPLKKLELSLTPELSERIDDAVELLGYDSREELVRCIILRFLDKYASNIRAC